MKTNRNFYLAALTLSLILMSCSKTSFTESANESNGSLGTAPQCGNGQITVSKPARVLFVVDQSGSNKNGPNDRPGDASDPDKKFRSGVLNKFLKENEKKDNVSWGLVAFNNSSSNNLLGESVGNNQVYFSNAPSFKNALKRFNAREDVGATPYKSALAMLKKAISQDLPKAPKNVVYLVVFLTDGYPTDYCTVDEGPSCASGLQTQRLLNDVQGIASLAPGSIQFSTAYYGLPDALASGRLEQMAKVGSGQFVDTNKSSGVLLDDLLKIDQPTCVNQ